MPSSARNATAGLGAFGLLVLGVTLLSNSGTVPEPMRRFAVYCGFVAMAAGPS